MKLNIRPLLFLPIACLTGLVLVAAPLRAADDTTALLAQSGQPHYHYLKSGKPEASEILPPPPLIGSAEQAADLEETRIVYHAASDAEKNAARSEKKFSVFNFTQAVGDYFQSNSLPKTADFFENVQKDAETVTDLGKDYFMRPRPFLADPSLANGKLERSFSYPSGHSTETMTLALVLADLLPEKRDAIIAHARMMGWHRVQIARHYPTDIYAGRYLALAIVKQFQKSDKFNGDFAAVKSELAAAQTAMAK